MDYSSKKRYHHKVSSTKVVPLRQFLARYPGAVNQLLRNRENILCRHRKDQRIKLVQFRALYQNNPRFWEHSGTWEYFLDRAVADPLVEVLRLEAEARRLKRRTGDEDGEATEKREAPEKREATDAPTEQPSSETEEPLPEDNKPAAPPNFGEEANRYARMDQPQREELLQRGTQRLVTLATDQEAAADAVAEALVDVTRDATLTNRAMLLEALRQGNDQARAYTQRIVVETHKMVKSTIHLVDSNVYNDDLVRSLVEKSNGTVVQHMTRVFLLGLEFLLYYNRMVITRGIANRIRIRFKKDYKEFYRDLLPHLHEDYVSLEHVFYGGMKALGESEITKFATGFLVHDVGKADDIEYHEGEEGFNRETVERHVKIGYKAVMDKTDYPREAALITGYHHEYYGSPHGYGYFREFLDAYKKSNPAATQDYVMAYTMEPLIDYEVLAYFPAKMLEIVDVFDSLTDPNRIYRKPLSEEEALELIRTEFIEKNRKIDPILFHIFLDFYKEKKAA